MTVTVATAIAVSPINVTTEGRPHDLHSPSSCQNVQELSIVFMRKKKNIEGKSKREGSGVPPDASAGIPRSCRRFPRGHSTERVTRGLFNWGTLRSVLNLVALSQEPQRFETPKSGIEVQNCLFPMLPGALLIARKMCRNDIPQKRVYMDAV